MLYLQGVMSTVLRIMLVYVWWFMFISLSCKLFSIITLYVFFESLQWDFFENSIYVVDHSKFIYFCYVEYVNIFLYFYILIKLFSIKIKWNKICIHFLNYISHQIYTLLKNNAKSWGYIVIIQKLHVNLLYKSFAHQKSNKVSSF